jgi:hypothetical protein
VTFSHFRVRDGAPNIQSALNSFFFFFFFTVSADYLQEFNKPFAVDENRVATTICYGRIIVVWNTFDGGVVESSLCGILSTEVSSVRSTQK